jgi:hypothetical protein
MTTPLDATPVKFRVPETERARFRVAMNESVESEPDTAVACALFVEVWKGVVNVTRATTVPLRASLTAETEMLAVLTIGDIPVMSMVACSNMLEVGHANTIHDVRFVFRHARTQQPLDQGMLEIEFWRDSVPLEQRRTIGYSPPPALADLAAQPDWAALSLDRAAYTRDRERIVDVMRLVRNMHAEMPIGISTALDLVYPANFYEPGAVVAHKRKRNGEERDGKRRKAAAAANGAHGPDLALDHVGYCIIFQCEASALPTINAAFMAHVERRVGPALSNWVVTFAHTKPVPGSVDQINRRCESLAIVLRRADCEDKDVVPHSIAGVPWLVRHVAAVE